MISFADVVHQQISFSPLVPSQRTILKLVDTSWFQRLRDISQTANTRLVYMFSEHSRFGHCLGVAYLAEVLLERLAQQDPDKVAPYRTAVACAALLHDVGHLAPGSHTAFKTWFPEQADRHEEIACRIVAEESEISSILSAESPELPALVSRIMQEDSSLPPWTWEIISGGGWNVDRGNWTIVDSVMGGVSYGKYNIPALLDAIVLTDDGHLALQENRLDAMMHFVVSRHALYRQVYQHRVILATDCLNQAVVRRARELLTTGQKCFSDETMSAALAAKTYADLSLRQVFAMRESWWRYHLSQWTQSEDKILSDLSRRLRDRQLFKTVRLPLEANETNLRKQAEEVVRQAGYDPTYYLHIVSTEDVQSGDEKQSMLVRMDDGKRVPLGKAEPLFEALTRQSKNTRKAWLVLPAEAKSRLCQS